MLRQIQYNFGYDAARTFDEIEIGLEQLAFRFQSTALIGATQSGHTPVVKYLIEKGADVDVENSDKVKYTKLL